MYVVMLIAASISLLAVAGLFLYLITFFKTAKSLLDNTGKTVQSLVEEVKTVRMSLQGTLQNVQGITEKAQVTLDKVNNQLGQLDGIVSGIGQIAGDASRITNDATEVIHAARGVVLSVFDLEQDIQRKVQQPIVESMTLFSAVGKGIKAFRHKIAGDGQGNGVVTDIYYK